MTGPRGQDRAGERRAGAPQRRRPPEVARQEAAAEPGAPGSRRSQAPAPKTPRSGRTDQARAVASAPRRAGAKRPARPKVDPAAAAGPGGESRRVASGSPDRRAGAGTPVTRTARPAGLVGKTTKPAKTTRPAKAAPPPRAPKPVPTGWWRGLGQPHKRQNLVRVALALVILAFAAKLVEVQVVDAQALAIQGQNSRLRVEVEPAQRGSIVSADGTVLAADVVRYEVQANQVEVAGWVHRDTAGNRLGEGAAEAAKLLAPLLGVAEDEALAKLDGTETYVRLIKEADQATWDEIKALGITGIYGKKSYVREYPAHTLAGNLIGYEYELADDAVGAAKHYTGIEATQTEWLTGKSGSQQIEVGAGGQPIPGGVTVSDPAETGCEVTLTINSDLQWQAQQAIDAQVAATEADAGAVVIIDIPTGEILALADSGTIDPGDIQEGAYVGSRAVETIFEPGSTGKVLTMAMLLETGTATPSSQYSVPSEWTYKGQVYIDSHAHGVEQLTLAGVLAESSNVGTVMAGQNVPDETRWEFMSRFGFGKKTGVELLNETPGILHKPGTPQWDGRTRNVVLFGQGVSVNALQATQVFATLGNGGVAVAPHLVKGYTCADGVFQAKDVGTGNRVVSSTTASQVVAMMESVVDSGTGTTAQIEGYRVAGKTGTSQILQAAADGSIETWHVGSFVGVAPADNPRIAVGVFIFRPRTTEYGSTVAGPVFKELMTTGLERLGVPPSTTQPAELPLTW